VKAPSKATLKKYGMTEALWKQKYIMQAGLCGLCEKPLEGKVINIDHLHLRNWKKLAAWRRLASVRALLHARCNRFLLGPTYYGFKAEHYRMAADYLDRWASRP